MFNSQVVENALYILALLNPASKVMFLSTYDPHLNTKQIFELSWKSSIAALVMLCLLAGFGELMLSRVFKVDLYSLQISGGMVLFMIGWTAVRKGRFLKKNDNAWGNTSFTDLSLVPLAAPLIAGPGTIAAAISSTAEYGLSSTSMALTIAISINFVIMLFSPAINIFMEKTHLLGPLIRLTGLIISTVAVQMIISGLRSIPF